MAGMGHNAADISQSVQLAPSELSSTIAHNYRPEGITLQMQTDVSVASSTAHANIQYGAGGGAQSFIPNLSDHVAVGDITMHAVDGTRLPVTVTDRGIVVTVGPGQGIPLHNLDASPSIPFANDIKNLGGGMRIVTDFAGYGYQGYRATNQGMELAR
jgi:hypothetical protein